MTTTRDAPAEHCQGCLDTREVLRPSRLPSTRPPGERGGPGAATARDRDLSAQRWRPRGRSARLRPGSTAGGMPTIPELESPRRRLALRCGSSVHRDDRWSSISMIGAIGPLAGRLDTLQKFITSNHHRYQFAGMRCCSRSSTKSSAQCEFGSGWSRRARRAEALTPASGRGRGSVGRRLPSRRGALRCDGAVRQLARGRVGDLVCPPTIG